MAKLPEIGDPTLAAADRALQEKYEREWRPRQYLGASSIGQSCERRGWLSFRIASRDVPDVQGIRRIEDGFRGEPVIAAQLQAVPGVKLLTHGDDGRQIGFIDLGGHFRGHFDGLIWGLLQAPRAMHVWECKVVDPKKVDALTKLKIDLGEKNALAKWDAVYYAQAQTYMHYSGARRHYLTVGSPGTRTIVSCRTDYDAAEAAKYVAKAERIVFGDRPPAKISDDPAWFECRWCPHSGVCHEQKLPLKNCRTCMNSTPMPDGTWRCERHDVAMGFDDQLLGCAQHLFHPDLVPGEQIDAGPDWVEYRLADGTTFINGSLPSARA